MTKPASMCTEEGCENEAEFSYVWPWGVHGKCCPSHRLVLHQKAVQQLDMPLGLQFAVLNPGKIAELTTDERVHHRASVIVRDEEIISLKASLTTARDSLSAEMKETLRLRDQVKYLQSELELSSAALQDANQATLNVKARLADTQTELDMLKKLLTEEKPSA